MKHEVEDSAPATIPAVGRVWRPKDSPASLQPWLRHPTVALPATSLCRGTGYVRRIGIEGHVRILAYADHAKHLLLQWSNTPQLHRHLAPLLRHCIPPTAFAVTPPKGDLLVSLTRWGVSAANAHKAESKHWRTEAFDAPT